MLRAVVVFLIVLVSISVFAQEPPADKRTPKDSSKLGKIELEKQLEQLKEQLKQFAEKSPTKKEMQNLQEQIEEVQKQLREIKLELKGPKGTTLAKVEAAADKAATAADWTAYLLLLFVGAGSLLLGYAYLRGRSQVARAKEHAQEAEKKADRIDKYEERARYIVDYLRKQREEFFVFTQERQKQIRDEIRAEGKRQRKISELSVKASRLYGGEKYDEAIEVWDKVIAEDPENAGAFNNRGNAKDKKGEHQAAILDYTEAIRLYEKEGDKVGLARAYTNRAIAKNDMGDYEGAIEDSTKAISLQPGFANAYNIHGVAKSNKGKYDSAINDFTRAIQISPNNGVAFDNRGIAKRHKGDDEGAISDHSKAISIFKKTGDKQKTTHAYNNRGYAFAKGVKDFAKGVEDCDKAIELDPSYSFTYASRGYAHAGLGEFEKAVADCEKALELDDKVAGSWYDYACALAFMKKKDKMLEKLQKAIELDPRLKKDAREDEDLKEYWDDEDFKRLTKE